MNPLAWLRDHALRFFVFPRMGPVLSESVLAAFEADHGVTLPEDYRRFLAHVGNGGPGPGYGLLPLEKALDYDNKLWGGPVPLDHLRHPFPHTATYNPKEDQQPDWQAADDGLLTEEEMYLAIFRHYRGLIGLAHEGCARYWVLVVTGPARGTVWIDATDSGGPFVPLGCGFLEWYENWLGGRVF